MKHAAWATMICGLIAYSCAGTETQNPGDPLKSFKDSGCKKEKQGLPEADVVRLGEGLVSTDYSGDTAGLNCIAWEVLDNNRTKVDLYNFHGACGAEWTGKAKIGEDGDLQLSLVNPECLIARCGWCIYDWSFEVVGLDTSKPLPLSLGIDTCPGEQPIEKAIATLPVNAKPSGILCNYAHFGALGWQAQALSECGKVGMPCTGTSMCTTSTAATELTCADDLVCTDNGNPDERICAKPCTADADCGTKGVLGCAEGLCRPKNNW